MEMIVVILLMAMLVFSGCTMGQVGAVPFVAVSEPTDVTVEATSAKEHPRIDITSESGIGEAQFTFYDGPLPDGLVFRLHLNGLENLTLVTDDVTIRATVASYGDHAVMQALVEGGEEQPIEPDSQYWLDITPVTTAEGQVAYFDVRPPAIIATNSSSQFKLSWIDFYR